MTPIRFFTYFYKKFGNKIGYNPLLAYISAYICQAILWQSLGPFKTYCMTEQEQQTILDTIKRLVKGTDKAVKILQKENIIGSDDFAWEEFDEIISGLAMGTYILSKHNIPTK